MTRDVLCVLFLYIVTLVLFRSIVFENAAFASEGDTAAALSYAHAGNAIKQAEGVDVVWMPYFFSGMPTFGNVAFVPHDVSYAQKVVVAVLHLLYLNSKWSWYVVYYLFCGVFMFLLARTWKLPRIAALFAALTFMLSPYGVGLAAEGHGSKLMALSYLPLVFLLTHLLFERRDLLSFGLLSAAVGTLMLTNHMQIVYYAFMVIGLYLLYHIILDFKQDKLLAAQKTALFLGALVIGFCISSYIYLSVYEYSTFSIRGGGTVGSKGGLAYDYATNWSMNPWELLTLLVPSFFGFSSKYVGTFLGQVQELPLYWGTMPWNTSSVYVGVVPLLLSAVALALRRNRTTIFFAAVSVIVLLMSLGKHFSLFYSLLFNYLPFFNKFRAPSMIMHLITFTAAFLGAYGLAYVLQSTEEKREGDFQTAKKTVLYIAVGFVAFPLLAYGLYAAFAGPMFLREGELQEYVQQYGQRGREFIDQIKQFRSDLLWNDYMKFVILTGAAFGAMWLFLQKKIQTGLFSTIILGTLLIDLFILDTKFINPRPSSAVEEHFQPDATIRYLKEQPGLFRVFPLGPDLFMDNSYAYNGLQSIGGYSPAKLKIYQTMIDSCLYRGPDPRFPLNMSIVDMLNARYLIAQGRLPEDRFELVNTDQTKKLLTYRNPHSLPRAFFVSNVVVAQNQSQVFTTLNLASFDPAVTAVLEKSLPHEFTRPDSSFANVVEYKSRAISIKAYTSSPSLLVLSEVYYPGGWKAHIDGQETEIFKTNYVLRSVFVPAGQHDIVFTFEPRFYEAGWLLSNGAWFVSVLCILLGLWRVPAVRARFAPGRPEQEKVKS